jgi:hypothetical protein
MRKSILIPLFAITVTVIFLIVSRRNSDHPTAASLFSDEANEIFVSSVAGKIDLNSGIIMESTTPAIPDQINYVDFNVYNHTDEPILFPNQGFGLTVFRYDEIAKEWENLPLHYVPHAEPTILPPRIGTWNTDVINSWSIFEDETTAWGYKHIRIYVSGKGMTTNKTYGAYLDVAIYLP